MDLQVTRISSSFQNFISELIKKNEIEMLNSTWYNSSLKSLASLSPKSTMSPSSANFNFSAVIEFKF